MRITITLISLCALVCMGVGQTITIKGQVTDRKGEPLPFANVYIEQSSLGTTSDGSGSYELKLDINGRYRLRCSFVGYLSEFQEVDLNEDLIIEVDFRLQNQVGSLEEVAIETKTDKEWSKNLRKFHKHFLGSSAFSKQCEITNPYVLDFESQSSILRAEASEPLEIVNLATGYLVQYELKSFAVNLKTDELRYFGNAYFEKKEPATKEEALKWEKNRNKAYYGSKLHFLRSLANNSLEEEGYDIYLELIRSGELSLTKSTAKKELPTESILQKIDDGTLSIQYNGFLRVENTRVQDHIYEGNQAITFDETSWIDLEKPRTLLNAKGFFVRPLDATSYGAFGEEGMSEALPFDFQPNTEIEEETQDESQEISKFFTNLAVYDSLYPKEKAFLSFDPSAQFEPGSLVPFDAYLFAGNNNQYSPLSQVLYVELISPSCELLDYVKVKMINGIGSGTLQIPNSIYSGNYEIRAYTSWMKNFGSTLFYSQMLQIGERTTIEASTVHFYPEYGRLLAKKDNRLGVRTTDQEGLPINAYVRVFDEKNRIVSEIYTDTLGIGSVMNFKPKPNLSYYALLNNSNLKWELPPIQTEETLEVSATESRETIKVRLFDQKSDNRRIYISGESCGVINFFESVDVSANSTSEVVISKKRLSYGINQIVLLDKDFNTIATKAFFLEENQPVDTRRSAKSFFNESVYDYVCWRSEMTDFSPYNLKHISKDRSMLDLFILAHGWDRIDYRNILDSTFISQNHEIEVGFPISGKIISNETKASLSGEVHLIAKTEDPQFLTAEVKSDGSFKFDHVYYNDTTDLMFSYKVEDESPAFEIAFDTTNYYFSPSLREACMDVTQEEVEIDDFDLQSESRILREVEITSQRTIQEKRRPNKLYTKADWSVSFEDKESHEFATISIAGGILEYLVGRVPGAVAYRNRITGVITSFNLRGWTTINAGNIHSALLLYEGISMTPEEFNALDPQMIGRIDVLSGPGSAVYGARASGGVIIAYAPEYLRGSSSVDPSFQTYNLPGGFSVTSVSE